jgi:hypothetical protein
MDGQSFFAINKVVDPGLIQVIENDIVPRLLQEMPNQPSETGLEDDPHAHRFVLVFDLRARAIKRTAKSYQIRQSRRALALANVERRTAWRSPMAYNLTNVLCGENTPSKSNALFLCNALLSKNLKLKIQRPCAKAFKQWLFNSSWSVLLF